MNGREIGGDMAAPKGRTGRLDLDEDQFAGEFNLIMGACLLIFKYGKVIEINQKLCHVPKCWTIQ